MQLAVFVSDKVPEVIVGDPGRFRQVITNLVGNSVKVSVMIKTSCCIFFIINFKIKNKIKSYMSS